MTFQPATRRAPVAPSNAPCPRDAWAIPGAPRGYAPLARACHPRRALRARRDRRRRIPQATRNAQHACRAWPRGVELPAALGGAWYDAEAGYLSRGVTIAFGGAAATL